MTDDLKIELKVGGTLRLEGPDGSVTAYTVKQIHMSNGVTPDWATTTPVSGRVTLTLHAEESRGGTWAQDVSDGTPTVVRAGSVIEAEHPD